jgi:cytochrome P450
MRLAGLRRFVRWSLGQKLPTTVLHLAARRGDLQGRIFSANSETQQMALVAQARESGDVYRGSLASVSSRLNVVRAALTSNDLRSGVEPATLTGTLATLLAWSTAGEQLGPLYPPSLLVTEPPEHTRYRALVSRLFTPRAVEQLRPRIEAICESLLAALPATGSVEIMSRYCTLVPVTVICELLAVPAGDRDRVLAFGAAAAPSLDLGLSWRQFRRVERTLVEFDAWLDTHIARLRASGGDDLFSQLIAARDEDGRLTDRELKATAGLILVAGFETTASLLGNGTALLASHDDQLTVLREHRELWPNAVDEILRYDSPVVITGRTTARDTHLGDTAMSEGTFISLMLGGANHDPAAFAEPERFDVTRSNAKEHIAFSAGRHYCLGAALARTEGEIALRRFFERYPQARITGGARRTTRVLRGYRELHVTLSG